jgi:hypothetical protein
MAFDLEAFRRAEFAPRTKRIAVQSEALAAFFPEGVTPEWEIKTLDASELNRALNAKENHKKIREVLDAIESGSDVTAALRREMGLDQATPAEVAKRMELLVAGSVEPKINLADAVKIARVAVVDFTFITNEITKLTGMGYDYAKPPAVLPETPSSETP